MSDEEMRRLGLVVALKLGPEISPGVRDGGKLVVVSQETAEQLGLLIVRRPRP